MPGNRLPTLFIPHGGGPCFFMESNPPGIWDRMGAWLGGVIPLVGQRPRAVLVISGHWEETTFTVNARPHHELYFDYYNFPEHTYRLTWPAMGDPTLAGRARELLGNAGFASAEDSRRGLDHGVFIPFKLIDPKAEIPVVQLSLKTGLNPAEHIAAGRALAPLRDEGVLIVGSGMSFHNMQRFRRDNATLDPDSTIFDTWLGQTVALPQAERERALVNWADAPSGRSAHPREEHLIPLHVVAGAAGDDPGEVVFHDQVLGSAQSAFMFGGPTATK